MKTLPYNDYTPKIHSSNFIASGAMLIGRLTLEKDVNIWFNSVLRADVNTIHIGEGTNVQDLSMLHVTDKFPLKIGSHVTIGHSAILHGCTVGNGCLIGMGSKILDGAIIGDNSLVAAGSLITPGKVFPAGSMIMGAPAKLIRELTKDEQDNLIIHSKQYVETAKTYIAEDTSSCN